MSKEDEIAGVSPEQPFPEAGRVIIRTRFASMWQHRRGTLAGDEDALHDMRVGSRRLRAALDVFAVAFEGREYGQLRRLTSRLTDALGGVRDHDVMLINLRRYRKSVPADERAGITDVMEALEVERVLARRSLSRFFERLDAADYAGRVTHLFGDVTDG